MNGHKTRTERIRRDIEELAKFSCVKSAGCTRFTYTEEWKKARDYVMREMEGAGLKVREDPVGIIIGTLEGKDPSKPVVMTGSHLDTVKTGGKFDGMAGTVSALETARVMHDEGFVPERSIEFVALPEEEGARFGSGLFGSRAMCGKLYPDELTRYKDKDGVSFAEAMTAYGLDPSKAAESVRQPGSIKAFIELHIEQGPILENEKTDVGIVESIVGLRTFDVFVHGRSDHAGNTPLTMRADTFLATAKAVTAGTEKALEIGENTVFTCGYITVEPGAFNIVTKETHFQIDCRSKTLANVDRVLEVVKASLDRSCAENPGLSYEIREKLSMGEVPMNEGIKAMMEKNAAEAGISIRRMFSGAGHDAMVMGSITDVAMIFVPSHEGRSHVPEEWTDYEDVQKGAELLYRTVKQLASE